MRIHTSARVEYDPDLMTVVHSAASVIVEEMPDRDNLTSAWQVGRSGRLEVSVVDRTGTAPPIHLVCVRGGQPDELREQIRRQCR